jgi:hypothetical protein
MFSFFIFEDTFCLENLSERDVVKQNKIICKQCNQEFRVNDIEFKSSKAFKKLVESQCYINE